jgi:hypothetical protein
MPFWQFGLVSESVDPNVSPAWISHTNRSRAVPNGHRNTLLPPQSLYQPLNVVTLSLCKLQPILLPPELRLDTVNFRLLYSTERILMLLAMSAENIAHCNRHSILAVIYPVLPEIPAFGFTWLLY